MVALALALAGCTGDPDPATTPSDLEITTSGPVICADPTAGAAQRFDRTTLPAQPITEPLLTGGGLALADLTGDGRLELVLPGEEDTQLWVGPAGTWVDEAPTRLAGIDLSMAVGASPADIDGDGDLDLLVPRWRRPPVLLANDGTGHFTETTPGSGLGAISARIQSASWGDFDRDGDLDLFLGVYGDTPPHPYDSPDNPPGDLSHLFRSRGDGTFEDISHTLPQAIHDGYVFSSGFLDVDGSGWPDLVSAHDFGTSHPSQLWLDPGDGGALAPARSGIPAPFEDMGMGVGDLDGDERPDFVFTSFEKVRLMESGPGGVWSDHAQARGFAVEPTSGVGQAYGWGAELGDVDNDGDLDAALAFGYWATYPGARDPLEQRDGLWLQDGAGQLADVAGEPAWDVADAGIGRGLLLADLDGDGTLDLVKRELGAPTPVYLSRCGASAWLRVSLRDERTLNTHAIGARVRVRSGDGSWVRWITAGSTSMYSSGPAEAHFGLGDREDPVRIEVLWPDGSESELDAVEPRQTLRVTRLP